MNKTKVSRENEGWVTVGEMFGSVEDLSTNSSTDVVSKKVSESAEMNWEQQQFYNVL